MKSSRMGVMNTFIDWGRSISSRRIGEMSIRKRNWCYINGGEFFMIFRIDWLREFTKNFTTMAVIFVVFVDLDVFHLCFHQYQRRRLLALNANVKQLEILLAWLGCCIHDYFYHWCQHSVILWRQWIIDRDWVLIFWVRPWR